MILKLKIDFHRSKESIDVFNIDIEKAIVSMYLHRAKTKKQMQNNL